ncbi:hypothetical protein L210DRAFT_951063 [Boletus edulis BED1]|uniref:Uncharacterized protein n=1 Tax=Boletus edulis BED1 TaxID=1328754 RepID=A0AAD4GH93_BOLED|nr:hypothetical protein L210DRAFT_951063 [Boletus edulis BED1]
MVRNALQEQAQCSQLLALHPNHVLSSLAARLPSNRVNSSITARVPPSHVLSSPLAHIPPNSVHSSVTVRAHLHYVLSSPVAIPPNRGRA